MFSISGLEANFKEHYKKDISLMRKMNIATVRVSMTLGMIQGFNAPSNELYRNNIMVIITLNPSKEEIIVNSGANPDSVMRRDARLFNVVNNLQKPSGNTYVEYRQ